MSRAGETAADGEKKHIVTTLSHASPYLTIDPPHRYCLIPVRRRC